MQDFLKTKKQKNSHLLDLLLDPQRPFKPQPNKTEALPCSQ